MAHHSNMTKNNDDPDKQQMPTEQAQREDKVKTNASQLSEEEKDARQAIEAMRKFANENEDDAGELSFSSIIGGDFLMSKFVRKQVAFVMFCVILMIIYTGNRYDSQKDTIVIDSLRSELQNVKYNVLTQSSELMNLIRQSNVEQRLKQTSDSLLHNSTTPPFLIKMHEGSKETMQAETREVVIGEAPEPISNEDTEGNKNEIEDYKTAEEAGKQEKSDATEGNGE